MAERMAKEADAARKVIVVSRNSSGQHAWNQTEGPGPKKQRTQTIPTTTMVVASGTLRSSSGPTGGDRGKGKKAESL
ncbi:2-oxoacid:acceptor oxidoreductase subunit alpha [Sesbania bispinosa]|nr:2-oxoacid:acceptor oxidoreductase subunit alpha [Sesbania bispinosa]